MKKRMMAAVLHKIGEQLRIGNVKVPELKPGEVTVRIRAAGICHSDLNYRDGISPVGQLPRILGHEISGQVVDIAEGAEDVEVGDRVCIHYVKSCGDCVYCGAGRGNLCENYQMIGKDVDGGFAEFINVPVGNVLQLPDRIPFEQGALIGCAVSTSFHALKRARVKDGDTVVIYGVGGVGLHAVQLAARVFAAGKVVAVDISDRKLKLAKEYGAENEINGTRENVVDKLRESTGGRLADVVLEFVGLRKTIEEAVHCVAKGGRLALVGIGSEGICLSPYKTMIGKEMELIGVNDHLKSEITQLIKLIQTGKVDLSKSITHKYTLKNINKGFEVLEKKIEDPLRVMVTL
jgi:2-desacetyl-2-hydroxyethyl bacteriochlorophyllide A dehydrogenase